MTQALLTVGFFISMLHLIGFSLLALVVRQLNIFSAVGFSFVLGFLLYASLATFLLLAGRLDCLVAGFWILALLAVMVLIFLSVKKPLPKLERGRRDLILLILLGVFFVPIMLAPALVHPIAWDAVVIWLAKAQSFFYEAILGNQLFSNVAYVGIHPDYPIGIPLLIAALYRLLGRVDPSAATVLLAWFLPMTAMLVVASVRVVWQRALIVLPLLMVLAVVPLGQVLEYYANGYVDLALSMAITATILAMCLSVFRSEPRWLLVAWLSSLAAGLIKNEGLVFLAITIVLLSIVFIKKHLTKYFLVGGVTLAPIIVWQVLRMNYGFSSDLAGGPPQNNLGFYLERLAQIGTSFGAEVVNYTHWLWALLPLVLIFLGLFVAVFFWRQHYRLALPGLFIILQALAYLIIYLLTPRDLTWHLQTSLGRLIMHLLPAMSICALFWCGIRLRVADRL